MATERPERRTRGEERTGEDPVLQISRALERVLEAQEPRPVQFKAPVFDGKGDIEYFTRQFRDVAEANQWNPGSMLLHLRASLTESAQSCGNADSVEEVFQALQGRFGMSAREARSRLTHLKRSSKTSLSEHATEVSRLTRIAYQDLPADHRQSMCLEIFQTTLGNAYLQRHLLAVGCHTLEEAIRAGNEFLQITPQGFPGAQVRMADEGTEEPTKNEVLMEKLVKMMASLTHEVVALKESKVQPRATQERNLRVPRERVQCWGCGKMGHSRRDCKTHPWDHKAAVSSGNGQGPQ